MPEILTEALATPGLIWLVLAVSAAGLVRGFSGFGSAMIIMPVASSVLPPVQAVIFVMFTELVGPLPNLRAALRDGDLPDVRRLGIGAVFALPLGLLALTMIDPRLFGWAVSAIVLSLLVMLMAGWRYQGTLSAKLTMVAGGLGGFMTGFSGIPGPPVIMLYMASTLPISVIRANFLLYLVLLDLLLVPIMWMSGLMVWKIALLGLLVGIPNLIANALGALMFNPDGEKLFRTVAYIVIASSAIIGLPLWKG